MIKFTSDEIIQSIDNAVLEYNNQFYKPEDKNKKLEFYDDENGINESVLNQLKKYSLTLNVAHLDDEEINLCSEDLKKLIRHTKFENISINMGNSKDKKQVINFDTEFIDELNSDIKTISLSGINLSDKNAQTFSNYNNLNYIRLYHCNINNPEIVSELNPNCSINIQSNKINENYIDKLIKLIEKHKGRVELSNPTVLKISEVMRTNKVNINDYELLSDKIDFSKMDKIKIIADEDIDYENIQLKEVLNDINSLSNATLVSNPETYNLLNQKHSVQLPTEMVIKNVSELSYNDVKENPNIQTVKIEDGYNTEAPQREPYSREDYLAVRKEIDKILDGIDKNAPQKQIFTEIYKRLAEHIKYNYHAISKEGSKDEKLQTICRNLYGGLIDRECVCAGYSDILRNVCACVGIESQFVVGVPNIDAGVKLNLKDPKGHAWNAVKLDEEWYFTDLTWDRNNVVSSRYPLQYFLKSAKDFGHDELTSISFEKMKEQCIKSVSNAEQNTLFTGKESKDIKTDKKVLSMNYLSSCAISLAGNGIRASQIKKAHNSLQLPGVNKENIVLEQ